MFYVVAFTNVRTKSKRIVTCFFQDVDLTTFVEHTCASDNVVSVIIEKDKEDIFTFKSLEMSKLP